MVATAKSKCSFSSWYPLFSKDTFEATILPIPENVQKYLEHDAFILPKEATKKQSRAQSKELEWSDGSLTNADAADDTEDQPTFPEFSAKILTIMEDYDSIFVKSNWSSPSDAAWVTPTKNLKCTTLDDVYLLLKSSDKISQDLCTAEKCQVSPCLVLKEWREINPAYEFRCFVINKVLVGICQRDVSQYHSYIEAEKYDIQNDIKTFFDERVKNRFDMDNYSIDVLRHKKDKVKILDFGVLDVSVTSGMLFTYEELFNISEPPEFRLIAEDMGIQPKVHCFCAPQEIQEFIQNGQGSMMDAIRREVEEQGNNENNE